MQEFLSYLSLLFHNLLTLSLLYWTESAKDARNLFKQMEENGFQEHSKRESFYGLENKETFKTTSAMLNLFRRLESQQDYASSSHHSDGW